LSSQPRRREEEVSSMHFHQIYDAGLAQYAYLIGCDATSKAILVDPERDIDRYLRLADERGLIVEAVVETHIHADFLSGARELAERAGLKVYLSALGEADGWGYDWPRHSNADVQFLKDGDSFKVGEIEFFVRHTPGHTPEHITLLVREPGATQPMGALSGDFLFVGDLGRPDLLEVAANVADTMRPSAKALFASASMFLLEANALLVWPGHGAGSACGKSLGNMPHTSLGYEKAVNPGLQAAARGEEAFLDHILADQTEPPIYFARMKHLNKFSPPLLQRMPAPRRVSFAELKGMAGDQDLTFVDTRVDRAAVMRAHLPGAFYAPLNAMFCTVVGSLIADWEARIVLIARQRDVEEATRRLVRIGYDGAAGYVEPDTLQAYFDATGNRAAIETIDFAGLDRHKKKATVVDVRSGAEHRQAHVPGAVHAPYTRLPEFADKVPESGKLLVYCDSGARASVAAAYLARTGRDVTVVNDEFANYKGG
jgi:hydroxyacylglutathione hydrolase